MSKENWIEEKTCENCLHHFACKVNSEYVPTPCRAYEDEAGYRKQSEGEWKGNGYLKNCSKCGNCVNFNNVSRWLYNFCPNCGAKMKGGAV